MKIETAARRWPAEDEYFLQYAGHLSVTASQYELLPDSDSVLERLLRAAGDAITSVEVRGTRHFVTDRLVACLAALKSVTSVEFVNQDISDQHAELLAALPALTAVSIVRSNALTWRGVAFFRAGRTVHVELVGCPLAHDGGLSARAGAVASPSLLRAFAE